MNSALMINGKYARSYGYNPTIDVEDTAKINDPKMKEMYREMTNVDIDEQRKLWDERGKGYYGEYKVFVKLCGNISDRAKIMMNLVIPNEDHRTELDMVIIHETGLYVFEVKHYKGNVYGKTDDYTWTQYFKTRENETFLNPIKQNEYHKQALTRMFPEIPIYSFIVFTNPECKITLDGDDAKNMITKNMAVCTYDRLLSSFESFAVVKDTVLSPSMIDAVFKVLKPFSKIKSRDSGFEPDAVDIADYYGNISGIMTRRIRDAENDARTKVETVEADARAKITAANTEAEQRIAAVERKYEAFFKMFEPARDIVLDDISVKDMVEVSDVVIRKSEEIPAASIISFVMTGKGKDYSLGLSQNTKLITHLKAGIIVESNIYSTRPGGLNVMSWFVYILDDRHKLKIKVEDVLILDAAPEDIQYVKLNNMCLYMNKNPNKPLLSNVDLEIYKA